MVPLLMEERTEDLLSIRLNDNDMNEKNISQTMTKGQLLQTQLDQLKDVQYFIQQVYENFDEKDKLIDGELKNLKEMFSKYKFNYLELETKEGFRKTINQQGKCK